MEFRECALITCSPGGKERKRERKRVSTHECMCREVISCHIRHPHKLAESATAWLAARTQEAGLSGSHSLA